ncbi:AAA family ATPase [Bacillaceae bacterium IKA-2]|nr:AAA family ATPase [Bacillaceae bacterium IKA-2]
MIISHVNTGDKAPYAVNGKEITVGDVTVNAANRQDDTEKVIDICLDNQLETMREGLGAWYVATIIIPPTQRELIVGEEKDEEGNDVMIEVVRPLDMKDVELRLWRLPEENNQNIETEEGVIE